jgi:hypothetical protein
LPTGVSLIDFGDGTGELEVEGLTQNIGIQNITLMAATIDFADTILFRMITYVPSSDGVRVGPNPFTESVWIFFDSSALVPGERLVVSIFNIAGEKVWENVNNSPASADAMMWDGRNSSGAIVSPGVYLVRVHTGRVTRHLKLLKLE